MAKKKQKRDYIEYNVEFDGKFYRYEESGAGQRILLLPGGGMEPGLYSRISSELSKNYCVITLARIGRAKMPERPDDFILADEADYFVPFLQTLNIDYIVGHSSGAVFAVVLAWRMNVKGMAIYEPPVCDREDWLEPFRKLRDNGHYVRAIRYAMKGMSASPFDKLPRIITLPIFDYVYKKNKPYVITFENCILSEMKGLNPVYDEINEGRKITTPTLVCMGGKTSKMLKITTQKYYDACEKADMKIYPKYSHISPLMESETFCSDVKEFFDSLSNPKK